MDTKLLKEEDGMIPTTETLFKKVTSIMDKDPEIAEQMSRLDYILYKEDSRNVNLTDEMYTVAYPDDGSEGCYLNLMLCSNEENRKVRVATFKTLDEGLGAWRNMGTLAGELSYLANCYISINT